MGSKLKGKTALVTGGAKRIGRAVSLALAKDGVRVVLHYNTSEGEAESALALIRERGPEGLSVRADLKNPSEAEELLPRVTEQAGPVDILVNNASIFPENRITDFTMAELDENVRINALAPLLISRSFAKQGRSGAIVNLLDTRITSYDAHHAAYHLSKRMLYEMTRMTAVEFAPAVRVNAVAPGVILPLPGKDDSYLEGLRRTNPLNRIGTVEGVAEAVLFLLESDFITGQVVFVDGGRHLKGGLYE
jgi:NAD(P)-dependent dehydrogenase (short-subunit alcohol dehydrogenase family)